MVKKICESCEKAFSSAQILRIHIDSIHNCQRDHKCQSCAKAFSHARYLERHINSVHNSQ